MLKSRQIGDYQPIKRGGFSLAELIIAMALTTLVFITMLSLQCSVITAQLAQQVTAKFAGDSAYAVEYLKSDIRAATVIETPAKGETSGILRGYINVNPIDLTSPVVPSKPAVYFLYCVDTSGGVFYRYTWTLPLLNSFAEFSCGNLPAPGRTRESLITVSEGSSLTYSFAVKERSSNVVETSYRLISRKEKIEGVFSSQVQRGL